jgi:hypothetical protein
MLVKSESGVGHWYDQEGKPAYTIIGKNGKERNTTLRDARTLNLYPSVTTIISVAAKPGLERWKQEQLLLASLTLPRYEGEAETDWIARVVQDGRSVSKDAAKRGTDIHNVLESYFSLDFLPEWPVYVHHVQQELDKLFGLQSWLAEASFSEKTLRFGGKVDLYCKENIVEGFPGIVIDFKTTTKPLDKISVVSDHEMQLAAYRQGLELYSGRCAICYINAETNDVKLIEIDSDTLETAWLSFTHLLAYYQTQNNI